ncbi:GlxA family transcriptional regulator [Actinoplanes sp. TFC3]|uniref:GlxA family transcriptional regulator n=1 Tax=Actinoplanes sp. TFC3 TaxID=1710355 RepID=UPI000836B06C|nr:helix-turn-helix domain-containing protein [Actinoplanes sp. TFC3]
MVVVGYEGAELLDIACVTTSLQTANHSGADPPYEIAVVSPGGHPITCESGLTLQSSGALERLKGPLDTLIISGGLGVYEAAVNPRIVGHIRRLAQESRRIASVCTGATILAAAGLLDGKRATTHWRYANRLARSYPQVTVDPTPIYIREGRISTSAGVTSALDLMLAFIEEDCGAELARGVARGLVTYLHRPGNQAQMSMFTAAPVPGNGIVKRVTEYVSGHLSADLSAAVLAALAGVSERHLTRLFVEGAGVTPGRYVREARVEGAAQLLSGTALPVGRVAARCGFGSAETLRQAFVERYGMPPSRYRATQRGNG